MKTSDPLSDLLTRLRNGMRAGHDRVDVPASRVKEAVLKVLEEEGFVASFRKVQEDGTAGPARRASSTTTRASRSSPGSSGSRSPGRRVYAQGRRDPRRSSAASAFRIVSTSQGHRDGHEGARSRAWAAKFSATSGEGEEHTVSRIGKMPVAIPKGVEVKADGGTSGSRAPRASSRAPSRPG